MNHIEEARMNLRAELESAVAHVELIKGALTTLERIKPDAALVSFEHEVKAATQPIQTVETIVELPQTGSDFWLNAMPLKEVVTNDEIFTAAVKSLGFSPNDWQKKKLRQRMYVYLADLTKSKHVKHIGTGQYKRIK